MDFTIYSDQNAPAESKKGLADASEAYGFIPNLLGVMAASPQALQGYRSLIDLFMKSSLSAVEKNVVLLTVAKENECGYCKAAHATIANMQKVDPEIIETVLRGGPLKDDRLEALRKFTAEVTATRGRPEADTLEAFTAAGFDQTSALDVILGVAAKTLSNYVNHIAETPVDDAFKQRNSDPLGG